MRYEDALDLLVARMRRGMPMQQALAGLGVDEASLRQDSAVLTSIGGLRGMFPNFGPKSGAWGCVQTALAAEFANGGQAMNSMKLAPFGLALAGLLASSALVMASSESGFSSVVMDFVRPAQEQEVLGDDLDGDGLPDPLPEDTGESADSPETTDTIDDSVDTPDSDDVAGETLGELPADTLASPESPLSPVSVESAETPAAGGVIAAASADSPDSPESAVSPPVNGGTGTADSPDSPESAAAGGAADSPDSDDAAGSGADAGESPDSDDSSDNGSGSADSPDSDDSGGSGGGESPDSGD